MSLNWRSFDTGAQDVVNFIQPSATAVAVNRILGTSPTQFFGRLNANGQVYLINPNGILFGAGSQVNVGGLVASTLDIGNAALDQSLRRFSGAGVGSVTNLGSISAASGGYVAFIANTVSNQGQIHAPSGTVALGAGNDVTLSFAGNRLLGLQVKQNTLDNLAENRGLIRAEGGAVYLSAGAKDAVLASVVNNTGVIEARSVENVNGTIVLQGGAQGLVGNSGTLDVSGRNAGESGGSVKVLGDQVGLQSTSRIDAAGDAGGGSVLVGGNFAGTGPEQHARDTTVSAGSSIDASALGNGHGGQVVVWSDNVTDFNGSIKALGGRTGGDGGSVETSGHHLKIGSDASVSTLAASGNAGSWLLDPQDFLIGADFSSGADITAEQITTALQSTNVTIKTGSGVTCSGVSCGSGLSGAGDIIILDGTYIGGDGWTSGTTLTLSAYRNVDFVGLSSIDASFGAGNIVLRADNTGTGIGSVFLANDSWVYGNSGRIDIYYNPTSYDSPRDYSNNAWGNLNQYMLVNLYASVASKTYDGTAFATLSSLSVLQTPTDATVDTSGATAAFSSKSAGSNKAVTISGITLGGVGAYKYALNGLDATTATISKANLSVTGVSAANKTYNGTTTATLSGTASVAAYGGDVVSVSGTGSANFVSKNVGTGKSVTVTGYTLSGADAGNYNIVQPVGLTANITKASLTVSGVSAANKTYDGTTAATLSGTASVSAFGSDVVSVTGTGTATFANKTAGTSKAITVTGYSLSGADAGNYNVVQPTGLTATINKADLALSGLSVSNKTYDSTTAATLSGTATVTALGSDVVSVTGTGTATFADKNAGTNKAITVTGYSLTGSDAGNYNVVQSAGLTATINKADLAIAGITTTGKTYDGTTTATLSGTASVTPIGSDVVSVSGTGTGTFDTKHVGTGKSVTVSGYTLSGSDAGNYTIVQPTGLTASISKASLTVSGVSAANKTYDGTTAATLSGTASVSAFGSDVVSVGGTANATFADKNVGNGKSVTVSGYTLSGTDAGNYNVVQPTGLTANIAKASLTVTGISAANKTYDSTTAATLSGTASVAAFGSDAVSLSGTGTATFADKNVGTGKSVTVTGYTLGGADAGNYNIVQPVGVTATIAKASLALTGLSASDKTYDGTTTATLAGTASVTPIGSDVVAISGTGTGTFNTKHVGTGKSVTVSGYTLTGSDAGNYNIVQPTGLTASIAKASITVSGITVADKSFDRKVTATVNASGAVMTGKIDGDDVIVTATGSFADTQIGADKTVTLRSTYSGADAGNYAFTDQATALASINAAAVSDQALQSSVAQVVTSALSPPASAQPNPGRLLTLPRSAPTTARTLLSTLFSIQGDGILLPTSAPASPE